MSGEEEKHLNRIWALATLLTVMLAQNEKLDLVLEPHHEWRGSKTECYHLCFKILWNYDDSVWTVLITREQVAD